MARARIVVGTTAVGDAADGPVQSHGARSYSLSGGDVKKGQSPVDAGEGSDALSGPLTSRRSCTNLTAKEYPHAAAKRGGASRRALARRRQHVAPRAGAGAERSCTVAGGGRRHPVSGRRWTARSIHLRAARARARNG